MASKDHGSHCPLMAICVCGGQPLLKEETGAALHSTEAPLDSGGIRKHLREGLFIDPPPLL